MGRDWWDLLIVGVLLALNVRGAIRGIREHDEIAQSLVWDSSIRAIALRDGTISEVNAKELVPGDIVHVFEVGGLIRCICQRHNLTNSIAFIDACGRSHSRHGKYASCRSIEHHWRG